MGTLRRFFKPSPARSALQTLLPSFTASVILQQDGNGKQLLANDEIARSFVARSLYDNKLGFDLETGYGMDFMDRHKAIYEKVRLKILFGAALVEAVCANNALDDERIDSALWGLSDRRENYEGRTAPGNAAQYAVLVRSLRSSDLYGQD